MVKGGSIYCPGPICFKCSSSGSVTLFSLPMITSLPTTQHGKLFYMMSLSLHCCLVHFTDEDPDAWGLAACAVTREIREKSKRRKSGVKLCPCVQGAVAGNCMSTHRVLLANTPFLVCGGNESQRGSAICSRSHSLQVVRPGLGPRVFVPSVMPLSL